MTNALATATFQIAYLPGTPEAAVAELARRKANKIAKRTGGERIEAASDWAFQASGPELKALAAQV